MGNVQIEKEIVMRPINTIKPYIRNPRKNEKTVELLMKLIPRVGFNVPLVIDERGIIVKGHARFSAAIKLGMTEVPCIITHADAEAIKADRITDNKISEFSEWVTDDLREEINNINFDLSDIGLPKVDFSEMPTAETIRGDIVGGEAATSPQDVDEMYKQFLNEQEAQEGTRKEIEPFYKVVCDKCGAASFYKMSEFS